MAKLLLEIQQICINVCLFKRFSKTGLYCMIGLQSLFLHTAFCFCNKDVIICMYCYWIFVVSSRSSTLAILGLSSELHMTNSHPVTSLHTWDTSSICGTTSTWQPEWQIGYMNTLGFFFHPRLVQPPITMFSWWRIELGPIRKLNLATMALVGAVKVSAIWKTIPFGISADWLEAQINEGWSHLFASS